MKSKNPWMLHLNKVRLMKTNKGKPLAECIKIAKKSYTPKK